MKAAALRWSDVAALAASVALVTSLPYLAASALTDPDMAYFGLKAVNSADNLTYAAWMRQAQDQAWFQNLYTTESQTADILLPFFWVLGRTAAALGIDVIVFQHVARAIFAFAMTLTAWGFTGVFLDGASRLRAFALLAFGTALPGLVPEASPISAAYDSAILAASWTLLLAAYGLFHVGMSQDSRAALVGSGLSAGALAIMHPYDAIPLGAVMLFAVLLPIYPGTAVVRAIRSCWTALPFLAGVAFTATQVLGNSVLLAWARDPRPFSPWILIAFGALWIGAAAALRFGSHAPAFLWVWLAIGLALLVVPSPVARRLVQGLQAPLAILGTLGFEALARQGYLRLSRLSYASFFPAAVLMLVLDPVGLLPRPAQLSAAQAADLREFASLPAGAILADPGLSYYIPPLSGRQVYCGNYSLTIDYSQKAQHFAEVLEGRRSPSSLPVSIVVAPLEWQSTHPELVAVRDFRTVRAFVVEPMSTHQSAPLELR